MESRHRDALRRIIEADSALRGDGHEPESFSLLHAGEGRAILHARWDRSWSVPSEQTIDDLAELGTLRIESAEGTRRKFALTMRGRDQFGATTHRGESAMDMSSSQGEEGDVAATRTVAVMHGRDLEARSAVYDFLRRIGLKPLEWEQLVNLTGDAAPYNGQAVAEAFKNAQAVVVVLTPDDIGFLHPDLTGKDEVDDDRNPTGQARLNVVLEAGMAIQSHPRRTVFFEIGRTRGISDLAGRNTVRMDGSSRALKAFANRLKVAGCQVDLDGDDWLDATVFEGLAARERRPVAGMNRESPAGVRRAVRHTRVELETIDRTVEAALSNGYWWNVAFEGLPADEFNAARDVLADHAEQIYDALSVIYVDADQLNKAASNHAQGGMDHYSDSVRERFESLRKLIAEARVVISEYLG